MSYRVFTLTVKWENQTAKKFDFYDMKKALEAAWTLRDIQTIESIKLKTEWRETPEWLKEIAKAGSALN